MSPTGGQVQAALLGISHIAQSTATACTWLRSRSWASASRWNHSLGMVDRPTDAAVAAGGGVGGFPSRWEHCVLIQFGVLFPLARQAPGRCAVYCLSQESIVGEP